MLESKKGLILEGGAMRGMFTAGVTDVWMENDIVFDGAIGVSAGAAFGCNYKSKQIGRTIRYNKRFCNDSRFAGWKNFFLTGNLYNVPFCYHEVPWVLDPFDMKTYQENPMEFYAVCTDVKTGEAVYHKCDKGDEEDVEWFRASASLPLLSKVVKIDEMRLLDGGIADSVPIKFFESIGYNRNVIILTRPEGYRKEKNKMIPLAKIMLWKYPNMVKAMANRHLIYNDNLKYIEEKEKKGEVLVIRTPYALEVGGMERDPEKLEHVYQVGRQVGLEYVDKVKAYLTKYD